MSWLKDILDENRRVVESWPAWKKGAAVTRDEVEFLAKHEMFTTFSQAFLDHDAEQRQVIKQQAQQIAMLQKALQLLYDVQNGCPLPKYQADWDKAMELTQQALREVS